MDTIDDALAHIQIERIWLELDNITYMKAQTTNPLDQKRLDATQQYLLQQEARWRQYAQRERS